MAIDVAQGGISGYHNYYVPDEFFLHNEEKGQILLRDGQRAAKVTEAFMVGLHLGVEEEVGSSSGLLMYRCGVSWGGRRRGSRKLQRSADVSLWGVLGPRRYEAVR